MSECIPTDPQSQAFRGARPEDLMSNAEMLTTLPARRIRRPEMTPEDYEIHRWDAERQGPKSVMTAAAVAARRGDNPNPYLDIIDGSAEPKGEVE